MHGENNDTDDKSTNQTSSNVADAVFDKTARLAVLYVQIALGAVGGTLVWIWLCVNRRRTSRVNVIIRNLAASDLLVICFACVMQVRTELMSLIITTGSLVSRFVILYAAPTKVVCATAKLKQHILTT